MNEIFKGMDNASEVINENFEKLDYEVIENENGRCVKYADGTMNCRVNRASAIQPTAPTGALFTGASGEDWIYPQPFINSENLSVQVSSSLGNRWADLIATPSPTSCKYNMFSTVSSETTTNVFLTATGNWR